MRKLWHDLFHRNDVVAVACPKPRWHYEMMCLKCGRRL